jgi:hypothetical protein
VSKVLAGSNAVEDFLLWRFCTTWVGNSLVFQRPKDATPSPACPIASQNCELLCPLSRRPGRRRLPPCHFERQRLFGKAMCRVGDEASDDGLIILLFADLVTASTVVRLGLPMSIDGRRLMSATQFTLGFPTVGLTAGAAHAMFEYAMVPLSDSSCLQTSRTARGSSPHSWRGSLSLGSAERSSSNARRVAQRGLDGDGACRTTISVEPRMGAFAKLQTAAVSWRGPLAQPGDR